MTLNRGQMQEAEGETAIKMKWVYQQLDTVIHLIDVFTL